MDAMLVGLMVLASGTVVETSSADRAAEYARVEIRGTLRHGVFAIGGETTGTEVSSSGVMWELHLGDDDDLKAQAEECDGKAVVVSGRLEVRKGVERKLRLIVHVDKLEPAPRD